MLNDFQKSQLAELRELQEKWVRNPGDLRGRLAPAFKAAVDNVLPLLKALSQELDKANKDFLFEVLAKEELLSERDTLLTQLQAGHAEAEKQFAYLDGELKTAKAKVAALSVENERLEKELGTATKEYYLKAQTYGQRIAALERENALLKERIDKINEVAKPLTPDSKETTNG
jgi:chromosome segregation ATPase